MVFFRKVSEITAPGSADSTTNDNDYLDDRKPIHRISSSSTNSSYTHDFAESKTDLLTGDTASECSVNNVRSPFEFIENFDKYHKSIVKYLPIIVIIAPTFLSAISKITEARKLEQSNKQDHELLGKGGLNYADLVVDFASVCLLCWVLKFLLDWPWNWYVQITKVKEKVSFISASFESKDKKEELANLEENQRKLNLQHRCSVFLCFVGPFGCGWLLSKSKGFLKVLVDPDNASSDTNVAIFIGCGLIRILIQVGSYFQNLTASIDTKTNAIIQNFNDTVSSEEIKEKLSNESYEQLEQRMRSLEKVVGQFAYRFDHFYNKHKFIMENPDQSFVSSKHFKIIEKEFNQLNFKFTDKFIELESALLSMCDDLKSFQNPIFSTTPTMRSGNLPKCEIVNDNKQSLHGVPLSPKVPTYLMKKYSTSSYNQLPGLRDRPSRTFPTKSTPSPQQNNDVKDLILPQAKITKPWPEKNELINTTDLQHFTESSDWWFDVTWLSGVIINMASLIQGVFWKAISFIPLKILQTVQLILITILELLMGKKNAIEMKNRSKGWTDEGHVTSVAED